MHSFGAAHRYALCVSRLIDTEGYLLFFLVSACVFGVCCSSISTSSDLHQLIAVRDAQHQFFSLSIQCYLCWTGETSLPSPAATFGRPQFRHHHHQLLRTCSLKARRAIHSNHPSISSTPPWHQPHQHQHHHLMMSRHPAPTVTTALLVASAGGHNQQKQCESMGEPAVGGEGEHVSNPRHTHTQEHLPRHHSQTLLFLVSR